jgi:hypothetical protein
MAPQNYQSLIASTVWWAVGVVQKGERRSVHDRYRIELARATGRDFLVPKGGDLQ